MQICRIHPSQLEKAASLLLEGELVAFPTETVYGLGACLFMPEAIQKIFIAKGRPSDNPLIAHISHLNQVEEIASDVPPVFYELMEEFAPGPLTLVVPKAKKVSELVSGGLQTIAIRMPSHKIAQKLIELVGQPLVAPSANLSGKPSATHFLHVLEDFEGKISAVIEGESSEIGIESTVVSLLEDRIEILRPGIITQEQIEECIQKRVSLFKGGSLSHCPSPGMKYRHYAPKATVFFFMTPEALCEAFFKRPFLKRLILTNSSLDIDQENLMIKPISSHSFYSDLRLADQLGCNEVFVFCDALTLKQKGLMNRIEKASGL